MIIIDLACNHGHSFEAWFQSHDVYEAQRGKSLIACPGCGSTEITRVPSAIRVGKNRASAAQTGSKPLLEDAALFAQFQRVLEHILSDSENVGGNFANEARRIFYNEAPRRAIHGEASLADYEELQEEGIEIMLIPAILKRENIN
ncbi:MAG: DUF1178 family protein [Candidatus Accumulibacter sp.]|jgi:hypothetical protein|nr:DUF1178 family protein [Accumulibacter sp.]